MYYVYILQNTKGDFHYAGLTRNLGMRMNQHQSGFVPITKGYLPVKLVWYCCFGNKQYAASFEKYLKSGSGRAFARKHLL